MTSFLKYTRGVLAFKCVKGLDLANVFDWLQANKLTLNMTKTEFMLVGSRQRLNTLTTSPTIRMNSTQVSKVSATKSLGVMIDDLTSKN